ncbi:hypothetical protein D3C80_985030 [compost metagenome]
MADLQAFKRQHLQARLQRQAIDHVLTGQQQPRLTVFEHVGQALLGIGQVQRNIGRAQLEDRQQRGDQVRGAR